MTRHEENLQNVKTPETPQQGPQPEFMYSGMCSQAFIALTLNKTARLSTNSVVKEISKPYQAESTSITNRFQDVRPILFLSAFVFSMRKVEMEIIPMRQRRGAKP